MAEEPAPLIGGHALNALFSQAEVVAKAIPAFAVVAFFLGAAINSMIFSQWDLVFLQIATPIDIGSSALSVSGLLLVIAFFTCFAHFVIDRRKWRIPGFAIILGLICVASLYAIVGDHYWNGRLTQIFNEYIIIIPVLVAIIYNLESRINKTPFRAFVSILTSTILYVVILLGAIGGYAAHGYYGLGELYVGAGVPDGCSYPYVLWRGEKAIVLNCSDRLADANSTTLTTSGPMPLSRTVVLYGPQGYSIVSSLCRAATETELAQGYRYPCIPVASVARAQPPKEALVGK